ncbi:MAG: NYN domain-containing protein [Verrucomicrobia bacterium]|nr:NYN domain-containing protein [Verrucomicrobiota bacterium]
MIITRQRVISLIDGFNLYHAILHLERPELMWVDLFALSRQFLKARSEELTHVYYFSAYAEHVSELIKECQKSYLRALQLTGVLSVLGRFKNKNRICPNCNHRWLGHEEKETDVNIALYLLNLAYKNAFDRALVVSNDSDLAPAIQMVRQIFPEKRITTVVPPLRRHSNELIAVSSDKTKVRIDQLERCLLPLVVRDASGLISVSRPHAFMPHVAITTR